MLTKFREFTRKNKNLNLILSGVALIYVWRGVWSLTDMFTFGTYESSHFWSYFIPMVLAFLYIYLNDYKFKELIHSD